MVTAVGLLAILVIVVVNSALAALATRFFRVRLHTRWGALLYTVLLTPFGLVLTTPVHSIVFGSLISVSNVTFFVLAVAVPVALGLTFDYFWMPAPDEVELPETAQ